MRNGDAGIGVSAESLSTDPSASNIIVLLSFQQANQFRLLLPSFFDIHKHIIKNAVLCRYFSVRSIYNWAGELY